MAELNEAGLTAYGRGSTLDDSVAYMGSVMSFLAERGDTNGRFALMDYKTKPGNEPPPHYHLSEHEFYYVLEGEVEFYCQDKVVTAKPGDSFFIPQGEAHAFYVRTPQARALMLGVASGSEPIGLDSYFRVVSEPAKSMELPSEAITYSTSDPSEAIKLAAQYGTIALTPEETAQRLPKYAGYGANLAPKS